MTLFPLAARWLFESLEPLCHVMQDVVYGTAEGKWDGVKHSAALLAKKELPLPATSSSTARRGAFAICLETEA